MSEKLNDKEGELAVAYVLMQEKSPAEFEAYIDPLLKDVPWTQRMELAGQFRTASALGNEEHDLSGLAKYLDSSIGGS